MDEELLPLKNTEVEKVELKSGEYFSGKLQSKVKVVEDSYT